MRKRDSEFKLPHIEEIKSEFIRAELVMLEKHGEFYMNLMNGRKEPNSKDRKNFIKVCQRERKAKTPHEKVWIKYLDLVEKKKTGKSRKIPPKKKYEVELDGGIYVKDQRGWTDSKYTVPPRAIQHKLNAIMNSCIDRLFTVDTGNVDELLERVDEEKEALNLDIAEDYVRKAIGLNPKNFEAYAKLCSVLRANGRPEQALKETEKFRSGKNFSLLTSRAAAMCDLDLYEKAKKELGPVLARAKGESKMIALMVVNRIKKEAPWVYEK